MNFEINKTMESQLIPIAPDDNLFLWRLGHTKYEQSFAQVFRETWEKIPLEARGAMKTYFEEGQGYESFLTGGPSPYIALALDWPRRDPRENAAFFTKRGSLMFWAPTITILKPPVSPSLVSILIAHELAHAYREAIGIGEHDYDPVTQNDSRIADELATRALSKSWGFDEERLDFFIALSRPKLRYYEKKYQSASVDRKRLEAEYDRVCRESVARYNRNLAT